MNWFKDLFIRKDSQAESLPTIPEKKKPNISEPVISFVETFKANPKRFKCKQLDLNDLDKLAHNRNDYGPYIKRFKLTDNHEKLSWEFTTQIYAIARCDEEIRGPAVVTNQEAQYIYDAMKPYFETLEMKRLDLILYRYRRPLRRKLMEIYCK